MSVFKVRVGAEGTLEVFLACVRFQMSLEIRIFEELLAANIAFELWISVINLVRFHSVFGTEDLSAGFTWMSLQLMSVLMSFQVPFISKLCAVCEDKIKVDFFVSNWTRLDSSLTCIRRNETSIYHLNEFSGVVSRHKYF